MKDKGRRDHTLNSTPRGPTNGVQFSLRKIIKTRGSFPTDEAALKLLYLAIKNTELHWRRAVEWTAAMSQFAIQFGDRFAGSADSPHGVSPLTRNNHHRSHTYTKLLTFPDSKLRARRVAGAITTRDNLEPSVRQRPLER